jgi:hypothetical protein
MEQTWKSLTWRDKIRRLMQAVLGLTPEALLRQLNPPLRGWANFYRNGAAKATFGKLDHTISSSSHFGSGREFKRAGGRG